MNNRDVVEEAIDWVNNATPDFDAYLNKAKQHIKLLSVELTQTRAERDELQQELYLQSISETSTKHDYLHENERLRADNERLREALKDIKESTEYDDSPSTIASFRIASEALKGDGE